MKLEDVHHAKGVICSYVLKLEGAAAGDRVVMQAKTATSSVRHSGLFKTVTDELLRKRFTGRRSAYRL